MLVENVRVTNGDDSICVKSPARDVLVRDSYVSQGNGLVIGTATPALVSNITFRNITADDTTFGCHIKFKPGQTGTVSGVLFEDIRVTQTAAATARRVLHLDHPGYAMGVHTQDQGRRRRLTGRSAADGDGDGDKGLVVVSNVTYRRIRAQGLHAGEFMCEGGALACTGFRFEDVGINASKSGCKLQNVYGSSSADVYPSSCALTSAPN